MKPLIGVTSNYQQKKYRLNSDYIASILRAGGTPVAICPTGWWKSNSKKASQYTQSGFSKRETIDYISSIVDSVDGLFLSGGNDIDPSYYSEDVSVPRKCLKFMPKLRIEFELSLLREIVKRGKPVLGTCFGMQLLNVAFGGSLYQDILYQEASLLNHNGEDHDINILHLPELMVSNTTYLVNSTHHQAVKKLGRGLETFALSVDNLIEGFYMKDYPFLVGIQWHPERMPDSELSLKILNLFVKKAEETRKLCFNSLSANNVKGGCHA